MTQLSIFEIPFFDTPTPKPEFYLEVRLTFNSNQVNETVRFQSLNVFNFVADAVTVRSWKYISELNGQKENVMDGNGIESMVNYFSELERAEKLKAKRK